MKTRLAILLNGLLLALVLGLSACEGDQGDIGPAGPQGEQGTQGEKGDKGDQGDSGSIESQTFGNIVITFSGKRYDDVPFTAVQDFKYFPEDYPLYNNSFYQHEGTSHFRIVRKYKNQIPSAGGRTAASDGNTIYLTFNHNDQGIVVEDFSFNTQIIDGVKLFHLNTYDPQGIEITDYSFNPSTGKLSFKFSYELMTYYDEIITVSGVANVILVESEPA